MPFIVNLEPSRLDVEPGAETTCTLLVRNTGAVHERFSFTVLGELGEYARVDPPAVPLLPNNERDVTVTFTVPHGSEPAAGTYPFAVLVTPSGSNSEPATEEGVVTVAGFSEVSASIRPQASRAAVAARHLVEITNEGNVALSAPLEAGDSDDLLRFKFRRGRVDLAPGETVTTSLRVRVRRIKFLGKGEPAPFEVRVGPRADPATSVEATLNQRALLPRWLPRLAVAAVALLVAGYVYAGQRGHIVNVAEVAPTTTSTAAPATTAAPTTTATTTTNTTAATAISTTTTPTTSATTATGPTTSALGGATAAGWEPSVDPNQFSCTPVQPLGGPSPATTVPSSTTTATVGPLYDVTIGNAAVTFQFTTPADAALATRVLDQYQQVCTVGGSLQAMVLEPYQPALPVLADGSGQHCTQYDPSKVFAEADSSHPTPYVTDSSETGDPDLQDLDSKPAALQIQAIARAHTEQCWIGPPQYKSFVPGSTYPDLEYWSGTPATQG